MGNNMGSIMETMLDEENPHFFFIDYLNFFVIQSNFQECDTCGYDNWERFNSINSYPQEKIFSVI